MHARQAHLAPTAGVHVPLLSRRLERSGAVQRRVAGHVAGPQQALQHGLHARQVVHGAHRRRTFVEAVRVVGDVPAHFGDGAALADRRQFVGVDGFAQFVRHQVVELNEAIDDEARHLVHVQQFGLRYDLGLCDRHAWAPSVSALQQRR